LAIKAISNYLSLVKFSHTIFAMPFALIGFMLAVWYENKGFETKLFVCVLLCMIFARSAAMAFNRLIDARFDALNPRTATREIPAGIIGKNQAALFITLNCLLFITTTWFINKTCFYLSPLALFIILFYSYTKRFTALCHFVLGVGLALAPIGAYLAVTNYFSVIPILFSFIVFTWVAGFDILYALQDEDFDKGNQLHSVPAALGRKGGIYLSTIVHIITASLTLSVGWVASFHYVYWIGATVFIALLIYQHILIKPNDISKINMAFATVNGIAGIVFALFTVWAIYLT
jgi:4-hydroxybenzoate polyprenyltransferase